MLTLSSPAVQITESCLVDKSGHVSCWDPALVHHTLHVRRNDPKAHWKLERIDSLSGIKQVKTIQNCRACAVNHQGEVFCWGENDTFQSGNSSKKWLTQPTKINLPQPVATVVLGGRHSCALTVTNELYCWGNNSSGECGPDQKSCIHKKFHHKRSRGFPDPSDRIPENYTSSLCPVPILASNFPKAIKDFHLDDILTCVVTHDSKIVCSGKWGGFEPKPINLWNFPNFFLRNGASPNYRILRWPTRSQGNSAARFWRCSYGNYLYPKVNYSFSQHNLL
jgi:hypothetical protein